MSSPRVLERLSKDAKVWGLEERVEPGPLGLRRLQVLTVRNDTGISQLTREIGLQAFFGDACPLNFFCGNEYTAGEAMEIADRLREQKPEPEAPSTIAEDYLRQCDELRAQREHRTVSAPGLFIQRT